MTRAIADLFFTNYNGNIMGVAWVYWRIYSLRVEQYIPRRFAPLDILHNPSGVYYPIYPCHAHYIITILFFLLQVNDYDGSSGMQMPWFAKQWRVPLNRCIYTAFSYIIFLLYITLYVAEVQVRL